MRSSSVVVLALVAAATAAPIKVDVEARQGAAGFSKILGNVASGAGLLSSGINIGNFLGGLFGGDEAAAKRALLEIEDLMTRELVSREVPELEARQGAAGFSKILGNLASGAGILSGGINIGNFLGGLLGGDEAAARELEARQGAAGFSKILGNVASGAGLLSSGINIGNFLDGLFGGGDAAARREIMEIGARELEARQGAAGLSKILGNVASGAGILSSGINIGNFLGGLFGGDEAAAKRSLVEMEEHLTRELIAREVSPLEARQGAAGFSKILGNLASGAGILSGGINIGNFLGGLLGGDDAAAKRSLAQIEDHMAREMIAREVPELEARQGAAGFTKILGNLASGAGILSSGINIGNFLGGLLGGDEAAARRGIMEVGARELDARQGAAGLAKVGGNLLNLGSLGFSLGNIGDFVSGLFSREELEAMVARDLEERQGLAGLAKVGNNLLNLGSLGFSLGNIGDFVGGLLGREVDEVMMREIIEQEIYRRAVADLD